MTLSRTLARPMLAGMFIAGGLDAAQNPESKEGAAEKVAPPVARRLGLPEDTVRLVRLNGVVQVAAGSMLALGWCPRLAAATLAGSLVPTTLAGHRFWEESDGRTRAMQRIQFLKNTAMLGGLILAATDTEGRPSVSWRVSKAAERARKKLPTAA